MAKELPGQPEQQLPVCISPASWKTGKHCAYDPFNGARNFLRPPPTSSAAATATAYLSLNQLWKPKNNNNSNEGTRFSPLSSWGKNFVYLCKNLITTHFASQECTAFFIFIIKTFGHAIQYNQRPKFSAANWFDIFSLFATSLPFNQLLPLINKL